MLFFTRNLKYFLNFIFLCIIASLYFFIYLYVNKYIVQDLWKLNRIRQLFLRVWSWLRINASRMPNTCKSNGVAILSGERMSNTYPICPIEKNNRLKNLLILHTIFFRMIKYLKLFLEHYRMRVCFIR